MANQVNKKNELKKNAVLEYLTTEHKWEDYALFFIGLILTVMGVYIFEGDLVNIEYTSLWIFDSSTKIKAIAIILIVIGTLTMLFAAWPFYSPSLVEMKKVTWPNKKVILNHSLRVFGFIIVLSLIFVLVSFGFNPLFYWLLELGA